MLGVALASTAVFWPGLQAPFSIYDDSLYLDRTLMWTPGFAGLRAVWDSSPSWNGNFIEFFPLRDTVYWALTWNYPEDPLKFHIASLTFHIIASVLVGLFAETIGVRRGLAALTALLFALHPIHVESAIWIAGLKDPLCLTFILVSLLAFQRYRRDERARWYGLSLVALVAALLVKSVAFVTPAIMALMLLLIEPRQRFREVLKLCLAPAIIAGTFLVQFVMIGKLNNAIVHPHGGSWTTHFILAAWAQVLYLKQAFFPSNFQLVYCHFPAQPPWDYRLWVAIALALTIGLLTWRLRHSRWFLFLLGWYALFLVPVSNLIPFPALMADRYLYYSIFSICLGFVLLIDTAKKLRFTVVPLVLLFGWTSFERALIWRDEELLWEIAAKDPACVEDTTFPAAQVFMLYSSLASTPELASRALQNFLLAAGLEKTSRKEVCRNQAYTATRLAEAGFRPQYEVLGHFLAAYCKEYPKVWYAQTLFHAGRIPLVAAQSAERGFNLDRTPERALLRAIARVSIGDTSPAEFIPAIILDYPTNSCRLLDRWLTLSPMDAPRFELPIALCLSNSSTSIAYVRARIRLDLHPEARKYLDPDAWRPINFFRSKPKQS